MELRLEPCSFCKSVNIDPDGWKRNDGVTGPACDDCGATAESIAAWNRRPTGGASEGGVLEIARDALYAAQYFIAHHTMTSASRDATLEQVSAACRAVRFPDTPATAPSELVERLKQTLQAMASLASVPMDLWDRHSNAVLEAAAEIARLTAERDRLQGVIERDRTRAAEIIGQIRGAVEPYRWLSEGRGSYAYDDERYQDEFRECMTALYAALNPMKVLAADWSDCPKDFQAARIDWKARAEQAERELGEERELKRLADLASNGQRELAEAAQAALAASEAREKAMREALEWYGEQARLARLIHSEGDAGRHALDADGGSRARAALTAKEG